MDSSDNQKKKKKNNIKKQMYVEVKTRDLVRNKTIRKEIIYIIILSSAALKKRNWPDVYSWREYETDLSPQNAKK